MSKIIKINKDILNKAFREHYSQYCDEYEFDEGFDDNIKKKQMMKQMRVLIMYFINCLQKIYLNILMSQKIIIMT